MEEKYRSSTSDYSYLILNYGTFHIDTHKLFSNHPTKKGKIQLSILGSYGYELDGIFGIHLRADGNDLMLLIIEEIKSNR